MSSRSRLTCSSVRSRTRVSGLMFVCVRIFSRGISTPAIRAIGYPCRCLCLGLVQITITVPWRRITLQLSQRALTEALTFKRILDRLLEAVGDPATGQVVRRKLDADPV